jgi:hypothetical protein
LTGKQLLKRDYKNGDANGKEVKKIEMKPNSHVGAES